MRILFTGGGSGGHFYPIVAIAEAIQEIAREERLLEPELLFAAPDPYDKKVLFELNIRFIPITAGKTRRYFSLLNVIDFFKTGWGIVKAFWKLLFIFPDVVFGKGGYGSFPIVCAARILGIPVIIHESDSIPGRANAWAGKFAQKIAISFPEAAEHFDPKHEHPERIALTGNPIRKDLLTVAHEGGREFLKIESGTPAVLILGGSSGAEAVNEAVIDALPRLVEHYFVIHQTGKQNVTSVEETVAVLLGDNEHKNRYRPFTYLDLLAMRMAAGAADLIISRAGASAIFEIAQWGKPSIIIPIPQSVSHDQHKNAFAYARTGAATVIEQENLTASILVSEIKRLMQNTALREEMSAAAKAFAKPDAARTIAREILDLALEHEK
ncbi:undecaprenyldiphospho-muramoylpentapeptide beta-N-acetylglucosaminyltransferase [Candidatus Wolfebacteria bacterium]|nr:undecaprenyldiphospho-muramoylpentapeptide beta-N-acetylglucosaminyltransferase [Candidatus Wolfebacteria bacterium]